MNVRRARLIDAAAVGLVTVGVVAAVAAPPDRLQGDLQKLMYVHVPSAWLAYLSFAATVVASIAWLRTGRSTWDARAVAFVECGVVFTGLTLVTGSIWGKPVWGVWWTWDPRLVTTAILFLVYCGYLSLRRVTREFDLRARRSAVFGIAAFVQVPIVHMSVVWWRTLHQPPTVLRPGHPDIDHQMLAVLIGNVIAFTFVFAALVRRRTHIAELEREAEIASRSSASPIAGDAVSVPDRRGAAHV